METEQLVKLGEQLARVLRLERALAVLDTETTGTSTTNDRVIELAVVRLEPDGSAQAWVQRFDPQRPIPAEATEVHKITNDDVRGMPLFRDAVGVMLELLGGCDLAGFNQKRFDARILEAEFERAGSYAPWAASKPHHLDAMKLFFHLVPHSLSGAVRFFCGREHDDAHAAMGDVLATLDVLIRQLEKNPDLPRTVPELGKLCLEEGEDRWVDPDGKIIRDEEGRYVFNFGKDDVRGKLVDDVAMADPGYLNWVLRSDFNAVVKTEVRASLVRAGKIRP